MFRENPGCQAPLGNWSSCTARGGGGKTLSPLHGSSDALSIVRRHSAELVSATFVIAPSSEQRGPHAHATLETRTTPHNSCTGARGEAPPSCCSRHCTPSALQILRNSGLRLVRRIASPTLFTKSPPKSVYPTDNPQCFTDCHTTHRTFPANCSQVSCSRRTSRAAIGKHFTRRLNHTNRGTRPRSAQPPPSKAFVIENHAIAPQECGTHSILAK